MPRNERARLEDDERAAHQPAPAPPEPQLLQLQRSAGNAAVTRLLQRDTLKMRRPDLKVGDDGSEAAMRAVEKWFDPFVAEVRKREAGSPVQSVAELVWIACELEYTDDAGQAAKVRDRIKPGVLEGYLRGRAKHQGIVLLEHRPMADVRGVQAEATAILGNLGRIPTEATFGGDENHITISLTGTVTAEAKVGAVKFEGEGSPGGVRGKASVKGNVGELEAHGSQEGVGASLKTPGGTKVGVDIGKGAKAELKAGDFVTVKGSVQPEGDGKVSWSAQITIGTLGDVITPADVAKVMNGAQDRQVAGRLGVRPPDQPLVEEPQQAGQHHRPDRDRPQPDPAGDQAEGPRHGRRPDHRRPDLEPDGVGRQGRPQPLRGPGHQAREHRGQPDPGQGQARERRPGRQRGGEQHRPRDRGQQAVPQQAVDPDPVGDQPEHHAARPRCCPSTPRPRPRPGRGSPRGTRSAR